MREMFGALVLEPELPERTSLQQAQGAAKPVHAWPGEAAQEMAGYFDTLLDQVMAKREVKTETERSHESDAKSNADSESGAESDAHSTSAE